MRHPRRAICTRSYGAADFVAFYDSHPDREQTWDLQRRASVAVIGVGNVGLDVARMLARTADELLYTDIPRARARGAGQLGRHRRAHVRPARTGAGQVHPGRAARTRPLAQRRRCSSRPRAWSSTPAPRRRWPAASRCGWSSTCSPNGPCATPEPGPHRRIHIHFLENPVEILGADGAVVGPAHRAAGAHRRRQRPRHRRVHRLGRAGGLPGGRLPLGGRSRTCRSTPAARAAERRRPGARPRRRRRCPASTPPAGSNAGRSA